MSAPWVAIILTGVGLIGGGVGFIYRVRTAKSELVRRMSCVREGSSLKILNDNDHAVEVVSVWCCDGKRELSTHGPVHVAAQSSVFVECPDCAAESLFVLTLRDERGNEWYKRSDGTHTRRPSDMCP